MAEIIAEIRNLLQNDSRTLRELEGLTGIPNPTLSRIANGKRNPSGPSLETLMLFYNFKIKSKRLK